MRRIRLRSCDPIERGLDSTAFRRFRSPGSALVAAPALVQLA